MISFVPAGMVVRIMFLPSPLRFAPMFPLRRGEVTMLFPFTGWLIMESGTLIRAGSLLVCEVETTVVVTGTWRIVEVLGTKVMGLPPTPEETAIVLDTEALTVGRATVGV